RASAPSTMPSAMRSLYEPVGFADSSLTTTSAAAGGTTRRRRTTGVRPIALRMESAIAVTDMLAAYHGQPRRTGHRRIGLERLQSHADDGATARCERGHDGERRARRARRALSRDSVARRPARPADNSREKKRQEHKGACKSDCLRSCRFFSREAAATRRRATRCPKRIGELRLLLTVGLIAA